MATVYPLTLQSSYRLKNLLLIVMGSLLLGLLAPLSIQLPFTPVPFTLGAHLCLGLGALLGPKRGTLAVLLYLFQGAMGLPVFAGGAAGFLHLLGPRGGYLLGYVIGTYATGAMLEQVKERTASKTLLALGVGNMLIFFFGACHLSLFMGLRSALVLGVAPFLVTDLLKMVFLTKILKLRYSHFAN